MKNNVVPAGGGIHANSTVYLGDERDKNCIPCHMHDYDKAPNTNDGFRSRGCNECHTYPGLPTLAGTHQLTTVHEKHVGRASDQPAVNNKGYQCAVCHYNFDHNQSGFYAGSIWDDTSVLPARINIRFDAAWNPGSPTYNGANASTQAAPGISTHNGACAATYCHGGTLGAGGLYTTPIWSLAPPVLCDSCHLYTKATLTSRSHQAHLSTTTMANGAAIDCADCHTVYNLAAGGTHLDGTVTFTGFAYSGNAGDKDPLTGLGSCGINVCHNDGQSAAAVSPYTWGTVLGGGTNSCTECHNATSLDAGDELARAAPDDADGRRGAVQRLPRGGDGGDARQRFGDA